MSREQYKLDYLNLCSVREKRESLRFILQFNLFWTFFSILATEDLARHLCGNERNTILLLHLTFIRVLALIWVFIMSGGSAARVNISAAQNLELWHFFSFGFASAQTAAWPDPDTPLFAGSRLLEDLWIKYVSLRQTTFSFSLIEAE